MPTLVVIKIFFPKKQVGPDFVADSIGSGHRGARCRMSVCHRQNGGDQDGTGMVGKSEIVIVQRVRGCCIDQGGLGGR